MNNPKELDSETGHLHGIGERVDLSRFMNVGVVSITFDENNVIGSNPNDFGAICQRQIFHMIFLQFADKDNTNERNESYFSNCRVQFNFCKVTSFYQITKVLCSFFPPLNLSCKITTESILVKNRVPTMLIKRSLGEHVMGSW